MRRVARQPRTGNYSCLVCSVWGFMSVAYAADVSVSTRPTNVCWSSGGAPLCELERTWGRGADRPTPYTNPQTNPRQRRHTTANFHSSISATSLQSSRGLRGDATRGKDVTHATYFHHTEEVPEFRKAAPGKSSPHVSRKASKQGQQPAGESPTGARSTR